MSKENAEVTRRLLGSERFAVMSTLQQSRKPGWPMISLAPYALSERGEPVLAMSGLAQHTRNLAADPRACLYVQERAEGDPQQGTRIAIMGRVRPASEAEAPDHQARYLAAHPEAAPFFELDFKMYVMSVEEVRFIAGFGGAAWVSGTEVVPIT